MTTANHSEPLDPLARFSWDWAPHLCDPAHGCVDYHRSWSLVRLLELGGALPAGAAFFSREMADVVRSGGHRVLVSGGADTGVSALVVQAFAATGVAPELIFTDRCSTPCWQNRLYARRLGLAAEVIQADIAAVDCGPVDAVVAHSFLPFIPAGRRPAVLEAWARMIRPGGVLLMSGGLAKHEGWASAKDPAAIAQRRASLEASALAWGAGGSEARTMAETAARFWMQAVSQPPALTPDSLQASLKAAGFAVERLDYAADGETRGPIAMVQVRHDRRRAEIVARRL